MMDTRGKDGDIGSRCAAKLHVLWRDLIAATTLTVLVRRAVVCNVCRCHRRSHAATQ
jgi:hypothetical protein